MLKRSLVLAGGVALVSFCAAPAFAADVFTLSSTTFKDGTMMPKKMANANPTGNNPNCVGENVSPQLSWSGAPEGTKSFVLLMEDPEGRGGAGVHHWVTYGIDAKMTGLAEGEASKPSEIRRREGHPGHRHIWQRGPAPRPTSSRTTIRSCWWRPTSSPRSCRRA